MRNHSSVISSGTEAIPVAAAARLVSDRAGIAKPGSDESALPMARRAAVSARVWGALGVLVFSMTLPATRVAVAELDPVVVGLGRGVVAGVLAALTLLLTRQPAPPRRLWGRLLAVAAGCIVGFPLLSAFALGSVPAAHAAVTIGLAPAATAVMGALRGGERPSRGFWIACAAGLAAVLLFAISRGAGRVHWTDLFILLAVLLVAWGYAEGAVAARDLGGWQAMCWALVIALPVLTPVVGARVLARGLSAGPAAWSAFAYVSLFSMFLGMFAWYRGLALGGIARIGQLQLAQPVLTLLWAALLLGETVSIGTIGASLAVLASVALTQRMRVSRRA
jgi:drug/metabolite transporter (DMT)-like permease